MRAEFFSILKPPECSSIFTVDMDLWKDSTVFYWLPAKNSEGKKAAVAFP